MLLLTLTCMRVMLAAGRHHGRCSITSRWLCFYICILQTLHGCMSSPRPHGKVCHHSTESQSSTSAIQPQTARQVLHTSLHTLLTASLGVLEPPLETIGNRFAPTTEPMQEAYHVHEKHTTSGSCGVVHAVWLVFQNAA